MKYYFKPEEGELTEIEAKYYLYKGDGKELSEKERTVFFLLEGQPDIFKITLPYVCFRRDKFLKDGMVKESYTKATHRILKKLPPPPLHKMERKW